MNIFVLDSDPQIAAQMHCDKHVVKMILETAQILSTVWHKGMGEAPAMAYKPTHRNHPCVIWAGANRANYEWLLNLGVSLCEEFEFRYGHTHKTQAVLTALRHPPKFLTGGTRTTFVCCMPDEFKGMTSYTTEGIVKAYRDYYRTDKAHILNYTKRQRPSWI